MTYELPTTVEVCGASYAIRSDYRAILNICIALADAELTEQERAYAALLVFYPDLDEMPREHYEEALRQCFIFIDCGEETQNNAPSPRLVDWEKDFRYIVSPINRALGTEIRAAEYMHWWTFVSAYMEIGECLFSQIVSIRRKRAEHKPLDKSEREWYRRNRDIVDIAPKYTEAEKNLFKEWGV